MHSLVSSNCLSFHLIDLTNDAKFLKTLGQSRNSKVVTRLTIFNLLEKTLMCDSQKKDTKENKLAVKAIMIESLTLQINCHFNHVMKFGEIFRTSSSGVLVSSAKKECILHSLFLS